MGALARLEPFGDELWLARAPLKLFGVPMGRVMTVAQLGGDALWVHSPAPLDTALRRELKELGEVRWVVAPNALHGHVSMGDYRTAFPEAQLVAAPRLPERRKDLRFDVVLGTDPEPAWAGVLDQACFPHRWMDEVLFHHRPSRTLITGDVCWNITGMPWRAQLWAGRRSGVGPTILHRRGMKDRAGARAAVDEALAWDPVRLVCGHGEPLASGAREALAQAYEFLR